MDNCSFLKTFASSGCDFPANFTSLSNFMVGGMIIVFCVFILLHIDSNLVVRHSQGISFEVLPLPCTLCRHPRCSFGCLSSEQVCYRLFAICLEQFWILAL